MQSKVYFYVRCQNKENMGKAAMLVFFHCPSYLFRRAWLATTTMKKRRTIWTCFIMKCAIIVNAAKTSKADSFVACQNFPSQLLIVMHRGKLLSAQALSSHLDPAVSWAHGLGRVVFAESCHSCPAAWSSSPANDCSSTTLKILETGWL